jgi:hypothetical protein
MKVKELIEHLATANPNSEVVLQKDPEGNGYAPLDGVDTQGIIIESDDEYLVYSPDWSSDDAGMDEAEWDQAKKSLRCVVLFPVN